MTGSKYSTKRGVGKSASGQIGILDCFGIFPRNDRKAGEEWILDVNSLVSPELQNQAYRDEELIEQLKEMFVEDVQRQGGTSVQSKVVRTPIRFKKRNPPLAPPRRGTKETNTVRLRSPPGRGPEGVGGFFLGG